MKIPSGPPFIPNIAKLPAKVGNIWHYIITDSSSLALKSEKSVKFLTDHTVSPTTTLLSPIFKD